uniref:Uncharacterized protein n=1 Tax=Sarcoptes scabiei TaxID=52283 RepID=A0A834R9H7_SARSC
MNVVRSSNDRLRSDNITSSQPSVPPRRKRSTSFDRFDEQKYFQQSHPLATSSNQDYEDPIRIYPQQSSEIEENLPTLFSPDCFENYYYQSGVSNQDRA